MTNKHPLTIQTCRQIIGIEDFRGSAEMSYMRAAYDKGAEDKLERITEWLRNNLDESYIWLHTVQSIDVEGVIADLKKAMRPEEQQQEDS